MAQDTHIVTKERKYRSRLWSFILLSIVLNDLFGHFRYISARFPWPVSRTIQKITMCIKVRDFSRSLLLSGKFIIREKTVISRKRYIHDHCRNLNIFYRLAPLQMVIPTRFVFVVYIIYLSQWYGSNIQCLKKKPDRYD